MSLEMHVTIHIKQYREGRAIDPRIANTCGVKPAYTSEYIAEWDRQMLATRFKTAIKNKGNAP